MVFRNEMLKALCAYKVVQLSSRKLQVEIRFVEIEYAIIEYNIKTICGVADA